MMTERDPLDTKISSTSFQHQFWQKEAATRDYNHPVIEFFAKQRIEFVSKYIPVNQNPLNILLFPQIPQIPLQLKIRQDN